MKSFAYRLLLYYMGVLTGFGIILLFASSSEAKYKIGIIDSGYRDMNYEIPMCKKGHYNFHAQKKGIGRDNVKHGSLVANLINLHAGRKDICFVIYKVIDKIEVRHNAISNAFRMARRDRVDFINISMVTPSYDVQLHKAMSAYTRSGGKVFAAVGNEATNLNKHCMTYPTCFKLPGVFAVGAIGEDFKPAKYSNFGSIVKMWNFGHIEHGHGTSFAAPRALGDYLRGLDDQ